MRVTVPPGCSLLLPVDALNSVHTLKVVQEKVDVELAIAALRFCLIDDSEGRDLPLVELKLGHITTSIHVDKDNKPGGSTKIGGTSQGHASMDYFNSNLSAWEPVIEPWPVLLSVEGALGASPFIGIMVNAERRLEVNVTPTLVTSIASTVSVRCAIPGRSLHSMMPLDPTPVRLKRTCV
jgi:hypothetical protein